MSDEDSGSERWNRFGSEAPGSTGGRIGGGPDSFRTRLEEDGEVGVQIVRSVAAVTGVEPSRLPPLGRTVDVDALDRLASTAGAGDSTGEVSVSFRYADCVVVLDASRHITIRTQDAEFDRD